VNRYNPDIHHRKSIRLKRYDYARAGAYFVTICVANPVGARRAVPLLRAVPLPRAVPPRFGAIVNGIMRINQYGRVVRDEWLKTGRTRPEIELGEFVVMPNHVHGILMVDHCRGTARRAPTTARRAPTVEQFGKPVAGSFPTIIRAFKSAVTKRINDLRASPGARVWQRNYYEHVIRDEAEYNLIASYIVTNPQRWMEDKLHPDNQTGNGDGTVTDASIVRQPGGRVVGARRAVPLRDVRKPGGRDE